MEKLKQDIRKHIIEKLNYNVSNPILTSKIFIHLSNNYIDIEIHIVDKFDNVYIIFKYNWSIFNRDLENILNHCKLSIIKLIDNWIMFGITDENICTFSAQDAYKTASLFTKIRKNNY